MLLRLPQLGTYAKETSAERPRVVFPCQLETYLNHVLCVVWNKSCIRWFFLEMFILVTFLCKTVQV